MTTIARGQHPIQDTEDYVSWANTLDSAGNDSGPARQRMQNPTFLRELLETSRDVVRASERMDVLKKYVYYGRDPETPFTVPHSEYNPTWAKRLDDHDTCTLFHAMCGWVTESGELIKMFIEALLEGKPFDRENVIEEVGDGSWYMALFAKWLGFTGLGPFLTSNYNKLTERYGTSWSQKGALERDTKAEMQAMASAIAPIADRDDGTTVIMVKWFDDTSQYNTLEEIVGQLSFVDYKDEQGHELVNNAAFVSLLQMAAGMKYPAVKFGRNNGPYRLKTPYGFTDLIPHNAGPEMQDAAVAKKMAEGEEKACICYNGSWNDQCPQHKCMGDLLAEQGEGQDATGSNN